MTEFFLGLLQHPFTWGMILGLLMGGAVWFQTWKAKREARKRCQELEAKLQHSDETQARVQRAAEDTHRRELDAKDSEIVALRRQIDDLKDQLHKGELRLQKEKSEGGSFLGKVKEKLLGSGAASSRTIQPAEVVEPEVLPSPEEESR